MLICLRRHAFAMAVKATHRIYGFWRETKKSPLNSSKKDRCVFFRRIYLSMRMDDARTFLWIVIGMRSHVVLLLH